MLVCGFYARYHMRGKITERWLAESPGRDESAVR